MSVYLQILEWSKTRPQWQRDALRRLVHRDELTRDEIVELADMVEAEFGVTNEDVVTTPLTSDDLPATTSGGGAVTVRALRDVENVALLDDSIEFAAEGLTLIYGPNGSGKSGYARLLKKFCRARKADEAIRSNVFEDERSPRATLVYAVDGHDYRSTWTPDASPPEQLGAVSVFDAAAVDLYVGSKLDVAYRPAGLDLLPRLATHCDEIRDELTRRQQELQTNLPPLPNVTAGTNAATFLRELTAKTKAVDIEAACTFGADKSTRKKEVAQQVTALEGPERKDQAKSLRQRAERLESVARHLEGVATALSDEAASRLLELGEQVEAFKAAAESSAASRFADHPVQPVGTALWRALFDSAASYFEQEVAPSQTFPGDDRCVLCHQELSDAARRRLEDFRAYVHDTTEAKLRQAQQALASASKSIDRVEPKNALIDSVLAELREESPELATTTQAFVDRAVVRKQTILTGQGAEPLPASAVEGLRVAAATLKQRAIELGTPPDEELLEQLTAELEELRASETLAANADAVRAHHRALQKIAKYDKCVTSAKTNQVTKQNGALTREAVTDALEAAFEREAASLKLPLSVSLQKGGTRKGEQLHVLQLEGAPDKTTPDQVASSGEAQLIALANFFTELATAPAKSAVIFDDPASHLDVENIEVVARKIADAAGERQTIVFTHDERLVARLKAIAADWGVPLRERPIGTIGRGSSTSHG